MGVIVKYNDSLGYRNKVRRGLWNICSFIFFRPFVGPLFWRWRITVLRLFGAKIGEDCRVSNSTEIWAPWNIEMGDYVALASKVQVYSVDKVVLADMVTVSQGAYICTASHDISSLNKPLVHKPITIKKSAWICADAFVGMGVTIGEGAVVGARAAVFKDINPWTVVGGNPAKFIKKRVIEK